MGKRRPANAQIRKLEKCTEELAGLVAKIRISMSEGEVEVSRESLDCDLSPEQIKTQQQQDLAWLIGHPDLIELNQGNYVGPL